MRSIAIYIPTSNYSTARVGVLLDVWGRTIQKHPAVSLLTFVTDSYENISALKYPIIKVSSSYDRFVRPKHLRRSMYSSWSLAIKDVFIMRHCIEDTKADWCLRMTDDVYLNIEAFDEFRGWLDAKGNPRMTPMAFGNCLMWKGKWLLQGGSGWIFSRKAAEMFIQVEDNWILSMRTWEDHHIANFLRGLGLTGQMASCPYFSGHFLPQRAVNRWKWNHGHAKLYMPCPEKLNPEACAREVFPFHKVAFVHSSSCQAKMGQHQWRKWFAEMPRDTMMYNIGEGFHICYRSNSTRM